MDGGRQIESDPGVQVGATAVNPDNGESANNKVNNSPDYPSSCSLRSLWLGRVRQGGRQAFINYE